MPEETREMEVIQLMLTPLQARVLWSLTAVGVGVMRHAPLGAVANVIQGVQRLVDAPENGAEMHQFHEKLEALGKMVEDA